MPADMEQWLRGFSYSSANHEEKKGNQKASLLEVQRVPSTNTISSANTTHQIMVAAGLGESI